jgi:hypothetical protein
MIRPNMHEGMSVLNNLEKYLPPPPAPPVPAPVHPAPVSPMQVTPQRFMHSPVPPAAAAVPPGEYYQQPQRQAHAPVSTIPSSKSPVPPSVAAAAAAAAANQSKPEPFPRFGVKFSYLDEFIQKTTDGNPTMFDELTVQEVCERYVKTMTLYHKTSYCDLMRINFDNNTQMSNVYVVYSSKLLFNDLIGGLQYSVPLLFNKRINSGNTANNSNSTVSNNNLAGSTNSITNSVGSGGSSSALQSKEVPLTAQQLYLWTEIFSVNHHQPSHHSRPLDYYTNTMVHGMQCIGYSLVILHWQPQMIFSDLKILFEIYLTIIHNRRFEIGFISEENEKEFFDFFYSVSEFDKTDITLSELIRIDIEKCLLDNEDDGDESKQAENEKIMDAFLKLFPTQLNLNPIPGYPIILPYADGKSSNQQPFTTEKKTKMIHSINCLLRNEIVRGFLKIFEKLIPKYIPIADIRREGLARNSSSSSFDSNSLKKEGGGDNDDNHSFSSNEVYSMSHQQIKLIRSYYLLGLLYAKLPSSNDNVHLAQQFLIFGYKLFYPNNSDADTVGAGLLANRRTRKLQEKDTSTASIETNRSTQVMPENLLLNNENIYYYFLILSLLIYLTWITRNYLDCEFYCSMAYKNYQIHICNPKRLHISLSQQELEEFLLSEIHYYQAYLLFKQEKYVESEKVLQKCYEIQRQFLTENNCSFLKTAFLLGLINQKQGQYTRAIQYHEPFYERMKYIFMRITQPQTESHDEDEEEEEEQGGGGLKAHQASEENLANSFHSEEEIYQLYFESIENIALDYRNIQNYTKAEYYYLNHYLTSCQIYNEKDFRSLLSCYTLGLFYYQVMKNYLEAYKYFNLVMKDFQYIEKNYAANNKDLKEKIYDFYETLGRLYFDCNEYLESEKILLDLLMKFQLYYGDKHMKTLMIVQYIAWNYEKLGRFIQAEKYYSMYCEKVLEANGPEHPFTIQARENLDLFYERQKQPQMNLSSTPLSLMSSPDHTRNNSIATYTTTSNTNMMTSSDFMILSPSSSLHHGNN